MTIKFKIKMSFFYLIAVNGDMPVHLLEVIVVKRLEYLKAIVKGDTAVYNEYVIEGSVYDNVGHFMLCIAAILGENTEFMQFFLNTEIELFKRRLESLTPYDLRCFAKKLLRSIKKQGSVTSYMNPLQVVCQHLILKDVAQHITSHTIECCVHNIQMNFRDCLMFIAKRKVELHNGVAFIPCGKWKEYIRFLFSNHLKKKLKCNLAPIKSDPRIIELLFKIKKEFIPYLKKSTSVLLSRNVDNASLNFPPCMLNLHQSLRKKHRLSHSQRFYYSLFLKDIGMPIEEAINFWRSEYRLSPNGTHSCCHNWEKDEKKYLYGIRHMYGLEGGRKNYASVNCHRIQSVDNACSEGGCPFKSFDDSKMIQLLKSPTESLLSQILEYKSKNQYTAACMLTVDESVDCDNFSFNFTPVKYYMISSEVAPSSSSHFPYH